MSGRERTYLFVLLALVFGLILLELAMPKPVDWTMRFERGDDRPFGARIFYEMLPHLFPESTLMPVQVPPFMVLRDTLFRDVTYLFLTDTFAPDAAEADKLLAFLGRGNTVFAAAHRFEGALADTLRLETTARFSGLFAPGGAGADSLGVNLVSPSLGRATDFAYRAPLVRAYFARFDTARTVVLGTDSRGEANLVRVHVGEGWLYLSTVPLLFTNYALLDADHAEYAYRVLSALPGADLWWDAYYKPARTAATTPLRYVLADSALRWAYYLALGGLVLFIVFRGKRQQRVIPERPPLKNATVAFVRTVGRLYYQHGDHAALAEKMITYFLDDLRSRLHVTTPPGEQGFEDHVAERSGVPLEEVRALFEHVAGVQARSSLTGAELVLLSRSIETFYQHSRRSSTLAPR